MQTRASEVYAESARLGSRYRAQTRYTPRERRRRGGVLGWPTRSARALGSKGDRKAGDDSAETTPLNSG
eukprot:433834-Prorocentrum_minimum.AAC.2